MSNEQGVERTTHGLRSALFDELDLIRKGGHDLKRTAQVVNVTNSIMNTIAIEMDVMRMRDRPTPPKDSFGELELADGGPNSRPALEHNPDAPPKTPAASIEAEPDEPVMHARIRACLAEKGKADISTICKLLGKGIGGADREDVLHALGAMRSAGAVMMHGANYLLARRA